MSMKRTLFKKYLRMTLLTIVASFCILGLVLFTFLTSNWRETQQNGLTRIARSVAEILSDGMAGADGSLTLDSARLEMLLPSLSKNNACDLLLTDTSGRILALSRGTDVGITQQDSIPGEIMEKALGGGYTGDRTMLGGIYRAPYFAVGVPVTVTLPDGGATLTAGAVFASVTAHSLTEYRSDMLQIFLFAALAAFVVSFCMIWIFSYNLVKPLRIMASAARSFGEGNFSVRVPVASRDEIGELAVAFNNMADSLTVGERTRRNFIANVSHELKTPMTTIAGFIDGILDGTIPAERQTYYLKIVSHEVKRLSRLVRTMLDLSRIDNGELKLHPARFDLTETVLTTLLTFEQPIEKKHIEVRGLEETAPIYVDGDPDMLHQVIYNLVENAVKFTNEGGYMELKLEDQPDRVTVGIKNSGEGVAPEEITQIFDRFYKTDKSRSKDKTGMGLGLYIVKTIIKQHGGEISASSVQGEYCQFSFWLPRQAASAHKAAGGIQADTPAAGARKGAEDANQPPDPKRAHRRRHHKAE